MKKILMSIITSAMLALSMGMTAQAAEGGLYSTVGAGAYNINAKTTNWQSKNSFGGYIGGGYGVSDNLDLELRLGATQRVNISKGATRVDAGLTYAISYLAKPHYEISDGFDLYALLGATTAKLRISSAGIAKTWTKTDFSYGLGASYKLTDEISAGFEWTQYLKNAKMGTIKTDVYGLTGNISYNY